MGETLACYTVSFLQILQETFSIFQISFIMIRHHRSVWMRALLYFSLAQIVFKIGCYTLQVLFHQIAANLLMPYHCQKKNQKWKCNAMSSRNLTQPLNKKRSQNSGGFLSSSHAKYDSGTECFNH